MTISLGVGKPLLPKARSEAGNEADPHHRTALAGVRD